MRIPASIATCARATAPDSTPRIWKRALVEGRRDLYGERLGRRQLAGQAIPLAHQVVAELQLVVDGPGGRHALDDLHAAGRAAPAAAAGRRDVDSLGVRRAQQNGPGLDADDAVVGHDRDGDG